MASIHRLFEGVERDLRSAELAAAQLDQSGDRAHSMTMSDTPSRNEIDAKLEAAEARSEARYSALKADIDVGFSKLDARFSRFEGHFSQIEATIGALPTKNDLWSWKVQWTAIAVAAIALVVGGIIGGLGWIKPDAAVPIPPPPVTITAPPPQIIYVQPPQPQAQSSSQDPQSRQ